MPDTAYRFDVVPLTGGGFAYRIFDGETVLLTSGRFLLEADAASVGRHFASDPDLHHHL
jgi:hypothetical protein